MSTVSTRRFAAVLCALGRHATGRTLPYTRDSAGWMSSTCVECGRTRRARAGWMHAGSLALPGQAARTERAVEQTRLDTEAAEERHEAALERTRRVVRGERLPIQQERS